MTSLEKWDSAAQAITNEVRRLGAKVAQSNDRFRGSLKFPAQGVRITVDIQPEWQFEE